MAGDAFHHARLMGTLGIGRARVRTRGYAEQTELPTTSARQTNPIGGACRPPAMDPLRQTNPIWFGESTFPGRCRGQDARGS